MPRWALASLAAGLLLIAALGSQSYLGRVKVKQGQFQGCLRAAQDRRDNADGWRAAERAWLKTYALGGPNAANALATANRYNWIAASLESRTRPTQAGRDAYCHKAYPDASILPWKA